MESQARTIEHLSRWDALKRTRQEALNTHPLALDGYLALQAYMERIDNDDHEMTLVHDVLSQEEDRCRNTWIEAKRELEVLERLREKRLEEWKLETARQEQRDLDEWATMRSAA